MFYYKEIVDNLKIDDVKLLMEKLGATLYKETDNYCVYNTICHHSDAKEASNKLYFYKDSKMFMCYSECGGMSIFKFLEHYYEIRDYTYDWYNDIYLVVQNCSNFNSIGFSKEKRELKKDKYKAREKPTQQIYDSKILDSFTHFYAPEWLNDGISKESMDKFNILYSISRNKIIIPHYNAVGDLIGIRGRTLNTEEAEIYGKYMPIQLEDKWYNHALSLNLYGLNVNKNNIIENGICYLFEGEKSVLQCDSFSIPNCAVSVCGSNINIYQILLLMRECHPKEIVICFDNEEKEKENKYFNKLYNLCKKYKKFCNFSFIYDRNNLTSKKDSPSDNGEEIFKQLLKERVVVK